MSTIDSLRINLQLIVAYIQCSVECIGFMYEHFCCCSSLRGTCISFYYDWLTTKKGSLSLFICVSISAIRDNYFCKINTFVEFFICSEGYLWKRLHNIGLNVDAIFDTSSVCVFFHNFHCADVDVCVGFSSVCLSCWIIIWMHKIVFPFVFLLLLLGPGSTYSPDGTTMYMDGQQMMRAPGRQKSSRFDDAVYCLLVT